MSLFDSALVEGAAESPVRAIIYEDLQCGDCAYLRRKLDERLLPAYGGHVAFEHRDFPLPQHSWARAAAIAAKYFHSIDAALAVSFRREIFSDLAQVTVEAFPIWVRAFAKRHAQDPDAAQAALLNTKIAEAVEADYQSGLARDVKKTPTVFVGDTVFIEWVPLDELMNVLDAALPEGAR
ncbi:MAG: thioredoxin domain-containing protein [Acidobacteria bacterium]|nr:thioredoxin domain-containing protein [Acidobacteriota bacterium]